MVEKAALTDASIVAVYDHGAFTLQEFEERYVRTVRSPNVAHADSMGAYEDFLERYVNFRLKLLEATESGYDKDPDILEEIHTYLASFARPYLVDRDVMDPLLTDLYRKLKEMVEASHIMIRVTDETSPEDTLAALERMTALRNSVLQGADFGDIAFRHSEDPSANNEMAQQGYRGNLGLFGAGRMIKEFEDWAYGTPVGEISPVFRSPYGYHMVQVHSREPAVANIRVSHIMARVEGTTPEDTLAAIEKLRGFKERIAGGEGFDAIATHFSQERNSAVRGGDIGYIRFDDPGLDRSFRRAAFAMQEVGTVSDIVESAYGLHILVVTERESLGTYEDEYEAIKTRASRMPRMRRAEDRLAEEARARYVATVDTTVLSRLVALVAVDSVEIFMREQAAIDSVSSLAVATLADSVYTMGHLAAFIRAQTNRIRNMPTPTSQAVEVVNAFLDHAAVTHDAMALERSDPEFRYIMQEFRDGLVLFEFMEDSVWTAATADSAALDAHYQTRREAYQFPDRNRIIEVFSHSDSLLTDAVARLDSGLSWTEFEAIISRDTLRSVRLDTILVEGLTNSVYDQALGLAPGEHTDIIRSRSGHYIALFFDGVEAARQKTFVEAKAKVISEYQTIVEDALLARLRAKYRAVTYPERLSAAFRSSKAAAAE